MDYEHIYTSFYSKYYLKTETLIKSFFIKMNLEKRTFGYSLNQVETSLQNSLQFKFNLYSNRRLMALHHIFKNRHGYYKDKLVQNILSNEIKGDFDKINSTELPKNYDFEKFIKDIAIIDIINEVSRLLSINNRLFVMYYNLNDFEKFEIREYGNVDLSNTLIYKELKLRLYPQETDEFPVKLVSENDLENEPSNSTNIHLSFQLALFEIIMKIENWEDLPATKKGKILTHLLGKSKFNIKKYYLELGKKRDNPKSKFFSKDGKYNSDLLEAQKIINELLG